MPAIESKLTPSSAPLRDDRRAPRGSVLIVDDEPTQRILLRRICQRIGIETILEAEDGIVALELAASHPPDLVLLDVTMPRLDGFETCRRLRSDPRHAHLPILMQTGSDDLKLRAQCFAAGATDFVTKPVHPAEIAARVRVHLENRLLVQSLATFRARMDVHLALAGKLADSLLPSAAAMAQVRDASGLAIDAFHRASEEIGGDFWALRDLGDGRALVLLVDTVGHGLAAAINAFRVESILRLLAERDAASLLAALDDRLVRIEDGRLTAAVSAVEFDGAAGIATICVGGAPTPLLMRHGEVTPAASGGLPVGTGLFTARAHALPLEPGDQIVLYSDGWAEGDPDRAAAILRAEIAKGASLSAEHLASLGTSRLDDDLTLIILSRRPT